jgi:hypothetical protein
VIDGWFACAAGVLLKAPTNPILMGDPDGPLFEPLLDGSEEPTVLLPHAAIAATQHATAATLTPRPIFIHVSVRPRRGGPLRQLTWMSCRQQRVCTTFHLIEKENFKQHRGNVMVL